MLAIGFIRQFQEVYRDSETIEGATSLADSKRRFLAFQKILCTVWFICIFLSQSVRDL